MKINDIMMNILVFFIVVPFRIKFNIKRFLNNCTTCGSFPNSVWERNFLQNSRFT